MDHETLLQLKINRNLEASKSSTVNLKLSCRMLEKQNDQILSKAPIN